MKAGSILPSFYLVFFVMLYIVFTLLLSLKLAFSGFALGFT